MGFLGYLLTGTVNEKAEMVSVYSVDSKGRNRDTRGDVLFFFTCLVWVRFGWGLGIHYFLYFIFCVAAYRLR